jgi:hypothetical protein
MSRTVNTPTTNASLSISPVVQYLPKPPLQDLNGITTAWIDTGIVIFLPQAARILQQFTHLGTTRELVSCAISFLNPKHTAVTIDPNDCLLSGIKAEFYSSKMSATSSHSRCS